MTACYSAWEHISNGLVFLFTIIFRKPIWIMSEYNDHIRIYYGIYHRDVISYHGNASTTTKTTGLRQINPKVFLFTQKRTGHLGEQNTLISDGGGSVNI